MKNKTINFLKICILIIGLITTTLAIFWLPGLATIAATNNPEYAHLQYPVLIGLYITVLPFSIALFEGFRLLNIIKNKQVFTELSVISLDRIKKCAMLIIILYVLGSILLFLQNALHPGIAIIALTIIFISIVIALFIVILEGLLKNAIEIKLDNDFTV